jgi:glycosyltransferase involved in cell wall biosynthesis
MAGATRVDTAARGDRVSRVLLITNEYPPEKIAGTAVATRFLAEELATRGHRVTVAVNSRDHAARREVEACVEVVRLRPLRLPMTRMAQRAALLGRLVRRVRPDVVQGQSVSCGCLALAAAWGTGIPTAVYVQGLDLYESSPWARLTYIKWALARCHAVVAVTDDLRGRVQALTGRHAEVIPHGYRLHDAHRLSRQEARAQLGLPAGPRVILSVGRLIRIKGPEHLIRAMPRVVAADPSTRLVLVGEGEQRAALEALVRDLGLGARVTFAGQRTHEDVIRFMKASDLFVLPSLIESFGIVLVEAMSCGLPIVASKVMGVPSVIAHGVNGHLVAPGDERGLADGIVSLLGDSDRCAAMTRANVERAAGYALPVVADRFLAVWQSLLTARGSGASTQIGEVRRWNPS